MNKTSRLSRPTPPPSHAVSAYAAPLPLCFPAKTLNPLTKQLILCINVCFRHVYSLYAEVTLKALVTL